MHRVFKSFQSLALGCTVLVSGALVQSLSAQDGKRSDAPDLGASEVAFEWQYSCINGKACSFNCPGSGGASNVTKLTLQIGINPSWRRPKSIWRILQVFDDADPAR